jgi:hypothetical protein
MSDLNVSLITNNAERIQPTPSASAKAADTLKEQNKDDSSRKERIKEVLEDVISVSKDGDTAQASKVSQDRLKENEEIGDVKEITKKEKTPENQSAAKKLLDEIQDKKKDEETEAAIERARENNEKTQEQIAQKQNEFNNPLLQKENEFNKPKPKNEYNSLAEKAAANKMTQPPKESPAEKLKKNEDFSSYTDAQLRQMYVNGDISRYAYDHEISSREESNTEKANEANSEKVFREGIVRAMSRENEAEVRNASIERAFDDSANANLQAEQRMAMIDAAELTG